MVEPRPPTSQPQPQAHAPTPAALPDPEHAFRLDAATITQQHHSLPKRDFLFQPHAYALVPPMSDAQHKHLVRIQVATPLSVLVSLAALVITSVLIHPGLADVSAKHVNYLTPASSFLLPYWALIFLLQVGYCILIVVSRKQETKKLILSGVGVRLALANFGLALWAIFWVLDAHWSFLAGEVILALMAVVLTATIGILNFKFHPDVKHPLDWLFVHVPLKLFLVVLLQVDLWQQLAIILRWDLNLGPGSGKTDGAGPGLWQSFGIITGIGGLLPALWIFGTVDFTWAAAGIFLHLAILFRGGNGHPNLSHRRPEIIAAVILAIAMQAVALFSGIAWTRLQKRQEGQIALPTTEEDQRRGLLAAPASSSSRAGAGAGAGPSSGTAIQAGSSSRGTVGVGVTDIETGAGVEEEEEAYRDEPRVTRTLGHS
ncbi:hypothetical protein OC842_005051 [Tilletia horrida]|uniref:Uncharacterized protein n=1 Tax=Tilletia horrida TaxID=155126 RepID=A0AAN6G826_9BASI|nr:hypothetical protein OC842_005051 [Tilletia horrida]